MVTLLECERTTRDGEAIGRFRLNHASASEDAGSGRGLYLGECLESRMVEHLCRAIKNGSPSDCVVVPYSYELGDEICGELAGLGVPSWQAVQDKKGPPARTHGVPVLIPEKLYLLRDCIRKKVFRPEFIHVADPQGLLDRSGRTADGKHLRVRGADVGTFKATCAAAGAMPFIAVWSSRGCASSYHSVLCNLMGVEAWSLGDGRTLRTAAFSTESGDESQSGDSHWLDKAVHRAYSAGQGIVVVCSCRTGAAAEAVSVLAKTHQYPTIEVSEEIRRKGIAALSSQTSALSKVLVRAAQKSNRQVTVLLGASVLWTALRDIEMFGVLASAAKHTTVVVAAPEDRSQEDLRSVATQMNASGPMANVIVEKCED